MDIDTAKADANLARSRLKASVQDIRDQFTPKAVKARLFRSAKKQGRVALIGAASTPKARPLLAVGMIATGAAYLLRKPILAALVKRLSKETDNDE